MSDNDIIIRGPSTASHGTIEEFKECFSIPEIPVVMTCFGKFQKWAEWKEYFRVNEIPFVHSEQRSDGDNIAEISTLLDISKNEFPVMRCDYQLRDAIYNNRLNEEGEYIFEEKEDGYLYPVVDEIPIYTVKEFWFKSIEEMEECNFPKIFHERFGLEEYLVEEDEEENV